MSPTRTVNVISTITYVLIITVPTKIKLRPTIYWIYFGLITVITVANTIALTFCNVPIDEPGRLFILINFITFVLSSSIAYTFYGVSQISKLTTIFKTIDYINFYPKMRENISPALLQFRKLINIGTVTVIAFVLTLLIYDVIMLLPGHLKPLSEPSRVIYLTLWSFYYFFCGWSLLTLLLFCTLLLITAKQILVFQIMYDNVAIQTLTKLFTINYACVIGLMELFSVVTFTNILFIFMNLLLGVFLFCRDPKYRTDLYTIWCIVYGMVLFFIVYVVVYLQTSVSI